jgi:predicted metalloprotease with PDZ domain
MAKALPLHCPAVKNLSKPVAVRPILAALAVLLICALVAVALWSRPAIISVLAPRQESQTREVDEAIGATVESLDPATARSLGLAGETHGAVITSVATGGPAARAGIRTGDVVVAIDRPLNSMTDLAAGIGKNGDILTVTLKRRGQSVIVPLTLRSRSGEPSLGVEEWR